MIAKLPWLALVLLPCLWAEVHTHPGGKELPHERYVRVVPDAESPVQRTYIRTKDGLYVAAALRKPKGDGPFPVLIHFHGAPGGRGMDKLVDWSSGSTGSPVFERFLREGFVVVVADYRASDLGRMAEPPDPNRATNVDDGLAVIEHVRGLPYVNRDRISLYGVSLGGNVVAHAITRTKVHAAILGAPATMAFLGMSLPPGPPPANPMDRFQNAQYNLELARRNVAAIQCPVLILVGTADSLIVVDRKLHDLMAEAGKPVRMDVYENGYHDFVMGPQGHAGRKEPLLESTLEALERALAFVRGEAQRP